MINKTIKCPHCGEDFVFELDVGSGESTAFLLDGISRKDLFESCGVELGVTERGVGQL